MKPDCTDEIRAATDCRSPEFAATASLGEGRAGDFLTAWQAWAAVSQAQSTPVVATGLRGRRLDAMRELLKRWETAETQT